MSNTRIAIADDHPIILKYLSAVLKKQDGIEVIGEASNGRELLSLLEKQVPDVAVIDLEMPRMNGYDAIQAIRAQYPAMKMVVFSGFLDGFTEQQARKLGVHATVSKSQSPKDLIQAIKQVARNNHTYFSVDPQAEGTKDGVDAGNAFAQLTPRENQILKLVGMGKTTRQIADLCHISPWTVDKHRANIKNKLGIKTLAGLIRFAMADPCDADETGITDRNRRVPSRSVTVPAGKK